MEQDLIEELYQATQQDLGMTDSLPVFREKLKDPSKRKKYLGWVKEDIGPDFFGDTDIEGELNSYYSSAQPPQQEAKKKSINWFRSNTGHSSSAPRVPRTRKWWSRALAAWRDGYKKYS